MPSIIRNISLILLLFVPFVLASEQEKTSVGLTLTGPYVGQKTPSLVPEKFASGFISTEYHEFSCSMTPDGKAFYFTRRVPEFNRNRIMVTFWKKEGWTEPCIAPQAGDYESIEPFVTYDGKKLFFQSWRPCENDARLSFDIWLMEKKDKNWSEPEHVGYPFNPARAMYISMGHDQTIYTTDISKGYTNTSIVFSSYRDGKYQDFQSIGTLINISGSEKYPCLSPTEEFLLFIRGTATGSDLYVTFWQAHGIWGKPIKIDLGLPKISMPSISPDGKFLFFTSSKDRLKGDIYWVDAKIIELAKSKL